jgi:hypothetical protein
MKRIGIVGSISVNYNQWQAHNLLFKVFDDIMGKYGKDEVMIVSGGTMYGIVKEAYFMAARLGYKTY